MQQTFLEYLVNNNWQQHNLMSRILNMGGYIVHIERECISQLIYACKIFKNYKYNFY